MMLRVFSFYILISIYRYIKGNSILQTLTDYFKVWQGKKNKQINFLDLISMRSINRKPTSPSPSANKNHNGQLPQLSTYNARRIDPSFLVFKFQYGGIHSVICIMHETLFILHYEELQRYLPLCRHCLHHLHQDCHSSDL